MPSTNKREIHDSIIYPVSEDGKVCWFMGYMFTRDGQVISPHGRVLVANEKGKRDAGDHITLIYHENGEKKLRKISIARAIYSMFTGEQLTRKDIVIFKDGNPQNCCIDNLIVCNRSDYTFDFMKMKKNRFNEEEAERIRKYYKETPGATYAKAAKMFHCAINTIQRVIKEEYEVKRPRTTEA